MSESVHVPILLEPITKALVEPFLQLQGDAPPHWIVDCTFGGGGHTGALLDYFQNHPQLKRHSILALDQDPGAVQRGQVRFKEAIEQGRLEIIHCHFGNAKDLIATRPVLGLLADLGFSSDQLEDPQRGLSFSTQGPLDMRLDPSQGESCYQVLSRVSEVELEKWLREWGEERFSKRIASALISQRRKGKLPTTTKELVDIVVHAVPSGARHGRIHVATRTFQALRIAVNEELAELENLLEYGVMGVRPGGRIAIMSFHSLEDRRVKVKFKEGNHFRALSKKPIQADEEEIQRNPRSRSAKLRIVERKESTD